MDLGVDLTTASYEAQPSFDPDREVFHYEHYATISGLLQAIESAEDVDAAVDVLVEQVRVAWILKSENRRLDDLGYRHNRPDPAAAYAHAGIELVDPNLVRDAGWSWPLALRARKLDIADNH